MAVPVQVDIKAATLLPDHRRLSRIDETLKLSPRLLGEWIAGRPFADFPVAIELAPVYAANNHVRPVTRPRVQLIGNRSCQLLRVRVEGERPLLAIRQLVGPLAASMRRGKNERQVARQVFDVSISAEIRFAGLIFFSDANRARDRSQNDADKNAQPSVLNHPRDR